MKTEFTKWVSCYGNAMSINENRPEGYARNITLSYPIYCPFAGDALRLTFDNYCGDEAVIISQVVLKYKDAFVNVTFDGKTACYMDKGQRVISDEIAIEIDAYDSFEVRMYFGEYASMRSSVYVSGPLSDGIFAKGNQLYSKDIPIDISRHTNIFYFLSDISIKTNENNYAIVCYGDSITAQDWPDYLKLQLRKEHIDNVSIIRKATSGSRILREYNCLTYESYGLMGKRRFMHEVPVDGVRKVIIQQGINDIIHPVGVEVNPFRPMSDLPTVGELTEGLLWYIEKAKELGLEVYAGTLLPINGWRTYADFREDMKNDFNSYIRNCDIIDGCIDFDKAVCDNTDGSSFAEGNDSGDHLHPSKLGYEIMANAVPRAYIKATR